MKKRGEEGELGRGREGKRRGNWDKKGGEIERHKKRDVPDEEEAKEKNKDIKRKCMREILFEEKEEQGEQGGGEERDYGREKVVGERNGMRKKKR